MIDFNSLKYVHFKLKKLSLTRICKLGKQIQHGLIPWSEIDHLR